MALCDLLRAVRKAYGNISARRQKRDLVGWPLPLGECGDCHPVREAMLLGFCQRRFGIAETVLYETIMARIERRQHAAHPGVSIERAGSG